ncbi:MAG: glycosyltransferase family 4 protein [Candidatus Pacearchaeota archaeon]
MIKVKLLAGTHAVYKEILNFPPYNISYDYPKFISEFHYGLKSQLKRRISSLVYNIFRLPRLVYIPKDKNQIIHSCRGILIINKKPWIIDFEHIVACTWYNFYKINQMRYKKIIEKFFSSTYCKAILPWSYSAKQTIFHYLNASHFKDKIEVVYPAIHEIKNIKKEKSEKIRILFVGHAFLAKGGLNVVEAFKILSKKYDIELTMITDLPKVYEKLKQIYGITFIPSLPREKVFEYYKKADIFCLPTYVDSFGFVLLEAKAFGLPIVASDFFAIPKLIQDGENGFLVKIPEKIKKFPFTKNPKKDVPYYLNYINKGKHKELVVQLVEKLKFLIENERLRKNFIKKGLKEIEKGKFSIKERNKKLKEIYENAIS